MLSPGLRFLPPFPVSAALGLPCTEGELGSQPPHMFSAPWASSVVVGDESASFRESWEQTASSQAAARGGRAGSKRTVGANNLFLCHTLHRSLPTGHPLPDTQRHHPPQPLKSQDHGAPGRGLRELQCSTSPCFIRAFLFLPSSPSILNFSSLGTRADHGIMLIE